MIIYNIRPKEQHTPYIYYTTKRRTWKINQRQFSNQQTTQSRKVDNQSSNFHPEKKHRKNLQPSTQTPSFPPLNTIISATENLLLHVSKPEWKHST